MQSSQARLTHSDVRHIPKLPNDILYLVAQFSSFEALVSLVQCNKSLHVFCVQFLFREIRLHKTTQLVKLRQNEKALNMLSKTKVLFLGEEVFRLESWAGYSDAPSYFITVLRAASSLLRLHIFDAPLSIYVSERIVESLDSMFSDPTFLPKLEVLVGTRAIPLPSLCENRPLKFLCSYQDSDKMIVEVYPSLSTRGTMSPTALSTLLEGVHDLSAPEIGTLIRESKGSLLVKCPYLRFTVRFPEEIRTNRGPPIPDLLPWLQEVIREAQISSSTLKWLYLSFDPLLHLPTSEQYAVITGIYELFPCLKGAQLAGYYTIWNRHQDSLEDSPDFLPYWTPSPNNLTFDWWLSASQLDFTGTRTQEEAEQIGRQLRKAMARRYAPFEIPTHEYLVDYLLNGSPRSDV